MEGFRGPSRYLYRRTVKRGRFAINELDRKLEPWLNYRNGFFVELGANDGFTQSNTIYLEIKRDWRGVLVEPVPNNYLKCVRLRSKPGNSIFCNACVSFDFRDEYVRMDYANLMTSGQGVERDVGDVEKHRASGASTLFDPSAGFSFGAVARTLTSILDDSRAPRKIDFLSLDVEGAELEVLKGIDFERYEFSYMLIECRDLDRLRQFLESFGYKLVASLSHHDYLFAPLSSNGESVH